MAEAVSLLPSGVSLPEAVGGLEEAMLRKAFELGDGVQSRAAEFLRLRRNVFKYKWDKYAAVPVSPIAAILAEAVPPRGDLVRLLAGFEEEILRRALVLAGGSQGLAAVILGLNRNVMPYKLKKYPNLVFED
jgi:DNA-binding protein Fis